MKATTLAIPVEVRLGPAVLGSARLVPGQCLAVGRSADANLRIDSPEVSRRHLTLERDGDRVMARNFSPNGTFHKGAPLDGPVTLELGSELGIGPYTLVLGGASAAVGASGVSQREGVRTRLVEEMDLAAVASAGPGLRGQVEAALARIAVEEGLGGGDSLEPLIQSLADEALGLGPLEPLLADDAVSEIMVVDYETIFVERGGKLTRTAAAFSGESSLRTAIDRILAPCGRRVDESSPLVDARLADGSRVHAAIPPVALRGSCLTVRKFARAGLAMADLVRFGSLTSEVAQLLESAVRGKSNIVISGGTGSGKTTLLNVLSSSIPQAERVVTIEDAAELRLVQPHVVSLEARPANAEGKGQITIRDLVRNALRMRPDRIVVGECRGGEALDMLQAMNTGHDGSLTTLHANAPKEALSRLETLCLMAGLDLPSRAIREQIAAAVHLVVQQSRLASGRRCVTSVAEVVGLEDDGTLRLAELYRYATDGDGSGGLVPTGRWPVRARLAPLSRGRE